MTGVRRILDSAPGRTALGLLALNRTWRGGNVIDGAYRPLRVQSTVRVYGSGNRVSLGTGLLYRSHLFVEGRGNELVIGDGMHLRDTQIWIKGDNCRIVLGAGMRINNAELGAEHDGSRLLCGDGTQLGGFVWLKGRANRTRPVALYAGAGCAVAVGASARIAENAVVKNYDSHDIYDLTTGEVQNNPRDVTLGDAVWVCPSALVLKGAALGRGSILGSQSVLTGDFSATEHALLVGSPARIVKHNVGWRL